MKIGIIGAGISGLALAHLLQPRYEVEILEAQPLIGGIARVADAGGFPYHLVGGHCFNTKDPKVKDFVFSIFPETEWNKILRRANIYLLGKQLSYPIEFSIRELSTIDSELALRCAEDFVNSNHVSSGVNLEDWFRLTFGDALAELYFIPYNKKIWGIEPKFMNSNWVKDKLPIPDKKSFLKSLLSIAQDNMVHSTFYYPKDILNDNLLLRMSFGKNITLNYRVNNILNHGDHYLVNQEKRFEKLIVTAPLDTSLGMFNDVPREILDAASLLKYNKISNMLWETDGSDSTWTYLPESSTIFHRHIHIGNFLLPQKNLTITEALGVVPYEVMVQEGNKFEYLRKPLAFNVSEHAYVLQDENKELASEKVKHFIESQGVLLCGRFAEWQYYNMDICIRRAMEVANNISSNTGSA